MISVVLMAAVTAKNRRINAGVGRYFGLDVGLCTTRWQRGGVRTISLRGGGRDLIPRVGSAIAGLKRAVRIS
jgi:hypothetical protein